MSRQYLHNACIRCPSLLLPPADAPARLPLGVPRAGGGACTLFSGEGDCPGSLVLHPLGRVLAMEMLASYRTSFLRYHRASGGPHVWYISTCRTPPLILSVVPGWLALARAATSFRPAGGRRVLCGMRAPCACVHQRTIAQVCRAFCAILAQNVGIVRKTCRWGADVCTSVTGSASRVPLTHRDTRSRPTRWKPTPYLCLLTCRTNERTLATCPCRC